MDIKIIEPGETKVLSVIDRETDKNLIATLVQWYGGMPLEEELDDAGDYTGYHLMTEADYDWWKDLSERYQRTEDEYHTLIWEIEEEMNERLRDAKDKYAEKKDDLYMEIVRKREKFYEERLKKAESRYRDLLDKLTPEDAELLQGDCKWAQAQDKADPMWDYPETLHGICNKHS
jgi:predicted phosphohydrolase